jgi:spore coat protein U-like protein
MNRIVLIVLLFLLTTAEAKGQCSVTTTPVNFGIYDVFIASPTDSTGTVTVICDMAPPPDVTISIDQSSNSGGFNPRKMKHSSLADTLNYYLFTDPSRTVIWGDGTGGTSSVFRKVTKNRPWISTIYGRIPAKQDVSVGSYSDILTVTIMW